MTKIDFSTYSLHQITKEDNFTFSPTEYSKFKFGDKSIARKFGYALATGFINEYLKSTPIVNQIVVISSPYCFIPTATFAMKDYFIQKLNEYLVKSYLPVVEETKIHRTVTYKEDYGSLSAAERLTLISGDGFHIDEKFIKGKTLLFLDDVKITGSHERVIHRMIEQYQLTNECVFLYFAELENKNIHPKIENHLNFFYVKSLLDLDKVIKNENFLPNTRVVKYILNSPFDEFEIFINYQSQRFVQTIYHLAIGNSYHNIPEYKKNLNYLKQLSK
jgi:hypothetical protein